MGMDLEDPQRPRELSLISEKYAAILRDQGRKRKSFVGTSESSASLPTKKGSSSTTAPMALGPEYSRAENILQDQPWLSRAR